MRRLWHRLLCLLGRHEYALRRRSLVDGDDVHHYWIDLEALECRWCGKVFWR